MINVVIMNPHYYYNISIKKKKVCTDLNVYEIRGVS